MFIASVPCNQWFLQAGCYDANREKPLRATVCLSIEHGRPRDAYIEWHHFLFFAGNIRELNIQQQDGNENINETVGLISKTTTLYVYHALLCIFLPILYENV